MFCACVDGCVSTDRPAVTDNLAGSQLSLELQKVRHSRISLIHHPGFRTCATPPGFSGPNIPVEGPQNGNGCDFGDLFLTKHSAPVAEVGFSGRLRLLCEVLGPGKAARGSEGGNGGATPPGFSGPKIPVEGPQNMATAVILEICF